MKKITGIAALFMCLTASTMVWAHPASRIEASFDPATKMLTARITHSVSAPGSHYIDKVTVALNGTVIMSQAISRQDDNTQQTVSYRVADVKAGDVLTLDTHCNKGGTLKKDVTVAE